MGAVISTCTLSLKLCRIKTRIGLSHVERHNKMLGRLFKTEYQMHKYQIYLFSDMQEMTLNKGKWVLISSEDQDRGETPQQAQSIDNPSVSITCAVCYHIRQQYDSPCSLTYYVGSHDSCKLHLSKQGPKILWHAITQTHTHTHTYLTCSVILTTHRHW